MSRTIKDSLDMLKSSLDSCKISLENKGVMIDTRPKVSELPALIDSIQAGVIDKTKRDTRFDNRETVYLDSEYNVPYDEATSLIFTDKTASVETEDVSEDKNNSVVTWVDGTTRYISTQDKTKRIGFHKFYKTFENSSDVASIFTEGSVEYRGDEYRVKSKSNLTSITFENVDTSSVTDFSYAFSRVTSLENVYLKTFDTSKATDMSSMFYNCVNLKELDINFMYTNSVKDFNYAFYYCRKLDSLDISNWSFNNTENTAGMFCACSKLSELYMTPLSENSNITSSDSMFYDCSSLPNYNSSYTDKSMAKYEEDGGYLTNPSEKPS